MVTDGRVFQPHGLHIIANNAGLYSNDRRLRYELSGLGRFNVAKQASLRAPSVPDCHVMMSRANP
jgi:hypothetical protein